jgi:Reeler domain
MTSARRVALVATALVYWVAGHTLSFADAYPSGAGQCIGGMAAVGGTHLTATAVTGPLSIGSLVVSINNQVIDESEIANFNVEMGNDYTILIQAPDGSFRGALIRASSPDGAEFTLDPGDNAADAAACTDDGVLGVTHTNNDFKSELGATLFIATAGTVTLDVTVVQAHNANDGSIYLYTPFTLKAEETMPNVPTTEPVDLPATPSVVPMNETMTTTG